MPEIVATILPDGTEKADDSTYRFKLKNYGRTVYLFQKKKISEGFECKDQQLQNGFTFYGQGHGEKEIAITHPKNKAEYEITFEFQIESGERLKQTFHCHCSLAHRVGVPELIDSK